MLPTEPLPLYHSWPLFEDGCRFELGQLMHGEGTIDPVRETRLLRQRCIGHWRCDLSDNRLTWSPEVHDLFGIPRDALVSRAESVARYGTLSRAPMERLRAYAIKHHRGFTLDVEIFTVQGDRRWIRLVAAPICIDGHVVALRGLKWDVSCLYT